MKRIRVPQRPGREFIELLDELSFEKPKLAAKLARVALKRVEVILLPETLAVYGTANRRSYELGKARSAFEAGLRMARCMKAVRIEANLLQRYAYVPGEDGELWEALRLTAQAGGLFEACGSVSGVGQCLVDQALWRFHLGHYRLSIGASRRALAILPASEHKNRGAAVIAEAYNLERLRDFQAAKALTEAVEPELLAPSMAGSLYSIVGALAFEHGDLEIAQESFSRSCELFFECEQFLAAALAGSHQVKTLLKLGLHHQACRVAKGLGRLIEGIHSKPALGLLTELIRQAIAGEIRIVEQVSRGIQMELARATGPRRSWST